MTRAGTVNSKHSGDKETLSEEEVTEGLGQGENVAGSHCKMRLVCTDFSPPHSSLVVRMSSSCDPEDTFHVGVQSPALKNKKEGQGGLPASAVCRVLLPESSRYVKLAHLGVTGSETP